MAFSVANPSRGRKELSKKEDGGGRGGGEEKSGGSHSRPARPNVLLLQIMHNVSDTVGETSCFSHKSKKRKQYEIPTLL